MKKLYIDLPALMVGVAKDCQLALASSVVKFHDTDPVQQVFGQPCSKLEEAWMQAWHEFQIALIHADRPYLLVGGDDGLETGGLSVEESLVADAYLGLRGRVTVVANTPLLIPVFHRLAKAGVQVTLRFYADQVHPGLRDAAARFAPLRSNQSIEVGNIAQLLRR